MTREGRDLTTPSLKLLTGVLLSADQPLQTLPLAKTVNVCILALLKL